jgi:hypothetical protein
VLGSATDEHQCSAPTPAATPHSLVGRTRPIRRLRPRCPEPRHLLQHLAPPRLAASHRAGRPASRPAPPRPAVMPWGRRAPTRFAASHRTTSPRSAAPPRLASPPSTGPGAEPRTPPHAPLPHRPTRQGPARPSRTGLPSPRAAAHPAPTCQCRVALRRRFCS